jgi:hypothetical protein
MSFHKFVSIQKTDLGFSWETVSKNENTTTLKLQIQTFFGPVCSEFPVQNLVLNPVVNIAELESEGLSWAAQMGLYPNEKMRGLEATFVSGLIATCYPDMSVTDSFLWDKWIRTLFAIDDNVDEGEELGLQLLKKQFARKHAVLQEIAAGTSLEVVLSKEKSPVIISLAHIFVNITETLCTRGFSHLVPEFIESTNRYFVSVIKEKEIEVSHGRLTDDRSAHIRAESSGAIHAITGAALLLGISTTELVRPDASFDYLLRCTALCVEFANDFLSQTKELVSLLKTKGYEASLENLERLKEIKRFNLVHIYWAEGKTLTDAYRETVAQYTKSFTGYQEQKGDLLQSLQNEKAEFSVRTQEPTDSPVLNAEYQAFLKKEKQVQDYLRITDGWMAHVWWALVARRYNLTYDGNPVAALQLMSKA